MFLISDALAAGEAAAAGGVEAFMMQLLPLIAFVLINILTSLQSLVNDFVFLDSVKLLWEFFDRPFLIVLLTC